jgi:hypothetical protein
MRDILGMCVTARVKISVVTCDGLDLCQPDPAIFTSVMFNKVTHNPVKCRLTEIKKLK